VTSLGTRVPWQPRLRDRTVTAGLAVGCKWPDKHLLDFRVEHKNLQVTSKVFFAGAGEEWWGKGAR